MKRGFILAISILLSICYTCNSQTWETAWEIRFGNLLISNFCDGIVDKNGGYTLLGTMADNRGGTPGFCLVRMDEKGDTTWSRTYPGSPAFYPKRVVQAADGGYLMVGSEFSDKNNSKLVLIKTGENGGELWRKIFGDRFYHSGEDLLALNDGSFIVAGVKSPSENLQNLWLFNVSPEGEIVWEKIYGGTNMAGAKSVKKMADGGFAVAGKIVKPGGKDTDAWILRTDSKGDTLWTSRIRTSGMVVWPECICCTPDSFLMVVGWQGTCLNGLNSENPIIDYDLILYKLDRKGKVILKKNVDSEGSEGGNNIVARPDGTFILAGKKETSFSGKVGPWLLHIDREGKILSENLVKFHFVNDQAAKIINTPDGGFIVVGPGEVPGPSLRNYAWVIKFNPI